MVAYPAVGLVEPTGTTAADTEVATEPVGPGFPEVGMAVVPSLRDLDLEIVTVGTESETAGIGAAHWPFVGDSSNTPVLATYCGEASTIGARLRAADAQPAEQGERAVGLLG